VVTSVVQVPVEQRAVPSTNPVCVETNVTEAGAKSAGTGRVSSSGLAVADDEATFDGDGRFETDEATGTEESADGEPAETPEAEGELWVSVLPWLLHEAAPIQEASTAAAITR
jgi:hypothetical protein